MEEFIGGVFIALGAVILAVALPMGLVAYVASVEASSLRELGFEAKAINFSCYAKVKGQWASCDAAVTIRQLQVKEEK